MLKFHASLCSSAEIVAYASLHAHRILGPYTPRDMTHTVRAQESRFIAHMGWFN